MSLIDKSLVQDSDVGGPAQALLIVNELRKLFPINGSIFSSKKDYVHAVNGVSFSINKGETLGIAFCKRFGIENWLISNMTDDNHTRLHIRKFYVR